MDGAGRRGKRRWRDLLLALAGAAAVFPVFVYVDHLVGERPFGLLHYAVSTGLGSTILTFLHRYRSALGRWTWMVLGVWAIHMAIIAALVHAGALGIPLVPGLERSDSSDLTRLVYFGVIILALEVARRRARRRPAESAR